MQFIHVPVVNYIAFNVVKAPIRLGLHRYIASGIALLIVCAMLCHEFNLKTVVFRFTNKTLPARPSKAVLAG